MSATGNTIPAGNFTGLYGTPGGVNPAAQGNYTNANVAAFLPTYTGNLNSVNNITASGNVVAQSLVANVFMYANGTPLVQPVSYGNSDVAAYLPNNQANIRAGNLSVTGTTVGTVIRSDNYQFANGTPLAFSVNYSNANVSSYLASTLAVGNIRGGNLGISSNIIAGNISITGDITSNTANTRFLLADDAVVNGNLAVDDQISAFGNITTSGFFVGNFVGNVTGNFVVPGGNTQIIYNSNGNAAADPDLTFNSATKSLRVQGNIQTENYFLGNGAFLTGIPSQYSNANVANYLPVYNGNIAVSTLSAVANISTAQNITAVGNITGNYFIGNGALLTGITGTGNSNYSNANVAAYLAVNTGNTTAGNLSVSGNTTSAILQTTGTGGNISGANVITSNALNTGTIIAGNIVPAQDVTFNLGTPTQRWKSLYVSGNTIFIGDQQLSAPNSSNLVYNGQNVVTSTGQGDISANNVFASANIRALNTVRAEQFLGDGSQLSNMYGNSNVSNFLAATNNNLVIDANAIFSDAYYGDAGNLSNISGPRVNGPVVNALQVVNPNQPNITNVGPLVALSMVGNISTSGNIITSNSVTATFFYGNGAFLTGVAGSGGSATNLVSGLTSLSIAGFSGNIIANVQGAGNILTITKDFVSVNGNVIGANLITSGNTAGNITGANVITANTVITRDLVGNVFGARLVANTTTGNIPTLSATGNLVDSGKIFDDSLTTNNNYWSAGQTSNYVITQILSVPDLPAVNIATTANTALSGLAAIDGVTPTNSSYILVKNQTNQDNGIWLAQTGAWIRQALVANAYANVTTQTTYGNLGINGGVVNVLSGTVGRNLQFQITTQNPSAAFGTAPVFVTATTKIPAAGPNNRFVDISIGNDTNNNGSQSFPFATITRALTGASYPLTVTVGASGGQETSAVTWVAGNQNSVIQSNYQPNDGGQTQLAGVQTFASGSTRNDFKGTTHSTGAAAPFVFQSGALFRNYFEDLNINTTAASWMTLPTNAQNFMTLDNISITNFNPLVIPTLTTAFTLNIVNQTAVMPITGTGAANTIISIQNSGEASVRVAGTFAGLITWNGAGFNGRIGSGLIPAGVITDQATLDTVLAHITTTAYDGYYYITGFTPTTFQTGAIFGKQTVPTVGTSTWYARTAAEAPRTLTTIGGNIYTPGNISTFTGLTTVGNVTTSVFGNVTANLFIGDGGRLSNLSAGSQIANGTSNINIATANGAIAFTVDGVSAGSFTGNVVSLGVNAGLSAQGFNTVAIGQGAGQFTQGTNSVAIGFGAGQSAQGVQAVGVGLNAGQFSQSAAATSVGLNAGRSAQGNSAVAVGTGAGATAQGSQAIAIGGFAGGVAQGANSIAIGFNAASTGQPANTIVLNATGATFNPSTANAFYVNPVRNAPSALGNVVMYNPTTREVVFGNSFSVTGNITGGTVTSRDAIVGLNSLTLGSNEAEGAQITMGWANVGSITGQTNGSWMIDVNSANVMRTFYQNSTGNTREMTRIDPAGNTMSIGGNLLVAGTIRDDLGPVRNMLSGQVITNDFVTVIPNGTTADILSFTLPAAGTYLINYTARISVNGSASITNWGTIFLTAANNSIIAESRILAQYFASSATLNEVQNQPSSSHLLTVTGPTTFKFRATAESGPITILSDGAGRCKVVWVQVSA